MSTIIENPKYSRYLLSKNGYRIMAGGKRILLPDPLYQPTTTPRMGYWVGGDTEPQQERKVYQTRSLDYLNTLGWGVYSRAVNPDTKYFKYQRVEYYLGRLALMTKKQLPQLPTETYINHDRVNNQIMLVGPNVPVKKWLDVDWRYKTKPKEYETVYDIIKNKERILKNHRHDVFGTEKKDFVFIENCVPIGINEAGELVGIPVGTTKDQPRIGIYGASGMGKTTVMHSICDRAMTYYDVKIGDLNDYQLDAITWGLPNADGEQELKRFNELPHPLPLVYLTPNQKDTDEPPYVKEGLGYNITLPFAEVISNCHKYFDLKDSAKYFIPLAKQIIEETSTPQEIVNLFATGDKDLSYEDYMQQVKAKIIPKRNTPPPNSITSIKAIFEDLYDKKVVDRWTDIPSKWQVYKGDTLIGEYNPFLACLIAGVMPILETKDLIGKPFFPAYFTYFAEDIFNRQHSDQNLKDTTVWLRIDEFNLLKNLYMIEQLQTRGRQRRIGTFISTQNYSKVQSTIKFNCNYLILFQTPEADEIVHDYGVNPKKEMADKVKKLPRFEFMAYSTQDGFAVYDSDGTRRTEMGPMFCKSLPTLSQHRAPMIEQPKRKART